MTTIDPFPTQLGWAAAAGILTHAVYLNRGEHHMHGARYLQLAFFSWISGIVLCHGLDLNGSPESWKAATCRSTALHASYITGIYCSLFAYRLLLNPLNRLPGPFSTRISALAFSWMCRNGNAHIQLAHLHSRYGHFVRINPGAVSVSHLDAIELVQGATTKCVKGPSYDITKPLTSLQMTRDKTGHAVRRKVWNPAFSEKAIRGYDQRIRGYQDRLVSKLAEKEGEPVNVTDWLMWYSFDVMGDMAFGKPFNMLENSKNHWAIDLSNLGIKPMSLILPMWMFRVFLAIPGLSRHWHAYFDFCTNRFLERMQNTPEIPDIMSAILAPHKDHPPTVDEMKMLVGDAQLIIAAGSDTSATTLTASLYYLAKNPDQLDKLRQELAPLWAARPSSASGIAPEKLATLSHMNGVINEALRLLPSVPTHMIRQAPPEGISIAGTYIPGGTDIWMPNYVLGRDRDNYVDPDKFIPERWYSSPELVKDQRAFVPFTLGEFSWYQNHSMHPR